MRRFLDADGIRYDVLTHYDDETVNSAFAAGPAAQYRLYSRILWKRIRQVWGVRRCRAAFVQRSLFALYPDARTPHLEQLARSLCGNVTLDFWDPVHLWQPELTLASLRHADTVAVVNDALRDALAPFHPDVRLLPIAVDVARFQAKTNYELGHPARLFYTGSPGNVRQNLEPLLPALESLARERELELVVVGSYAPASPALAIRRFDWDESSYYRLLAEADLALFPFFGRPDRNRLRVASKTLDYLAAGVPFVGVKDGLAAGVEPGLHFIAVDDPSHWPERLRTALSDAELRAATARRGRELVGRLYAPEVVYAQFKRIVFEKAAPTPPRPAHGTGSAPAPGA